MATPDSPQSNGLLCWLRCDEASGDLIDASLRGYDATAQGNIDYQQAGKLSYGIAPNTSAAIAIIPKSIDQFWSSPIPPTSLGLCQYVSVQAWFKPAKSFSTMWGTKHALVYKSSATGTTYGWFLGVLPGGGDTIVFRIMDAATTPYTASYVETDFVNWHHYVGTFDGSYVRLYRDGIQVAQTFVSGTIGHSAAYQTTIGEGVEGTLDEIAVWNRALTATEVLRLYGDPSVWKTIQKVRADVFFPYGNGTLPAESLHSSSIRIGPFAQAVTVYSGTEDATDPLTSPNDQWVVNGSNWLTPAWINISTPHVIAAGTVLGTLAAGQTLLLQLRQKYLYDNCYGYGSLHVKTAGVAGEALNIVLPTGRTVDNQLDVSNAQDGDLFQAVMNDGLSVPINPTPAPMTDLQVAGDFSLASAIVPDAQPVAQGVNQAFDLFEDVINDPLLVVDSVTADGDHLMTLTGSVGPSNVEFIDLYWEVELSTGMVVIPVSPTWLPFTLHGRQQFVTTYQIPTCIGLQSRRARFSAEAPGPGALQQALRWSSAWVTLNGGNYTNPCSGGPPPKLPLQYWSYLNNATPISPLTASGVLTAIKQALDAWQGCDWAVDQYTAGEFLTVKRKVSSGGVADTYRGIIFPGIPSDAALAGGSSGAVPKLAHALYVGACEDAGNAVVSNPGTGAPWGGAYSGAVGFGSSPENLSGVPAVFLVSCDRMLVVMYYGSNGWAFCILGELLISLDQVARGIWGCLSSGITCIDPAQGINISAAAPLPMGVGQTCVGSFYADGAQQRLVRGVAASPVGQQPLKSADGTIGYLLPIAMESGGMLSTDRFMIGMLRQICLGPYDSGRKEIQDDSQLPQAVFLNGGTGIVGSGLYLSQLV
jgi:hypothetical protein